MTRDSHENPMTDTFSTPSFSSASDLPAGASSLGSATFGAANDFVDFYQMLEQPRDTPTINLRSRINEMYAEAQANRDHRNVERRRQYAHLLQWIPQARAVLLHEGKRAKYDVYAARAKSGGANENFRAFLEELTGESDLKLGEGESILGLRAASAPTNEAPTNETPRTAQLSPRLQAARAAAGEAAVKITASAKLTAEDSATSASAGISAANVGIAAANASATNAIFDARATSQSSTRSEEIAPRDIDETPFLSAPLRTLDTSEESETFQTDAATASFSAKRAGQRRESARRFLASGKSTSGESTSCEDGSVKAGNAKTRNGASQRVTLNPELQRERASLLSSAAGFCSCLIVLLALRVALPHVSLLIPGAVSVLVGLTVWRVMRRRLRRGLARER